MSVSQTTAYREEYKEKCKMVWYAHDRPDLSNLLKHLKNENVLDENGRLPSKSRIQSWIRDRDWHIWADEMDAKAMVLVEDDLILQKAHMLREQAKRGFELQNMGMAALKEDGFDSSSAAVQAVIRGAELERTSRGIGEMIVKMAKMSNDELTGEIMKQLQRAGPDVNVVEVESEDISDKEKEDDTESA